MKFIFATAFIALSFANCNSENKETAEDLAMKDSLLYSTSTVDTTDHQISQADKDSIAKQEKIAFGSLQFGMTKREADAIPKKERQTFQTIGTYEYMVNPSFDYNGKLYRIELQSLSHDASYLNTDVEGSHDNLVDIIKKKYGDGTYIQPFPSILNFESGYIKWTHSWQVGNKIIKVGAGEQQTSAEFYSICWIYDTNLYDAKQARDEKKADTTKSKDASKF